MTKQMLDRRLIESDDFQFEFLSKIGERESWRKRNSPARLPRSQMVGETAWVSVPWHLAGKLTWHEN